MTALALDVVDALVGQFSGLTDITVLDGEPVDESTDFSVLTVGYSPEGGSVRSAREPVGMTDQFSEAVYVACFLVCWTGDAHPTVFADLRARLRRILADIEASLVTNRTLGGVVSDAEVDLETDLLQVQTQRGAEIMQSLVITCRRY